MKKILIYLNEYQFEINPTDISVDRKPRDTEIETVKGVVVQYFPDFKEQPIGLTLSGKCKEDQLIQMGNIYQKYLNDHEPIRYVCNYYKQNWRIRPTSWSHTRAYRNYGLASYTFSAKVVEVSYDYGSINIKTEGVQTPEREIAYTVKQGDTLWSIAQAYYGDGRRWLEIAQYSKNKGKILENGSVVPGTVIYIPITYQVGGGSARPQAR